LHHQLLRTQTVQGPSSKEIGISDAPNIGLKALAPKEESQAYNPSNAAKIPRQLKSARNGQERLIKYDLVLDENGHLVYIEPGYSKSFESIQDIIDHITDVVMEIQTACPLCIDCLNIRL